MAEAESFLCISFFWDGYGRWKFVRWILILEAFSLQFFFKLTLYTFIMQKNWTQMKPQVVIIQMLTLWISCCCVATTPQHHSLHHLHIPYHLPLTVPNHPPNWDLAFGPTFQQAGLREGEEAEGSCLMTQLWWRLWQDDRVWRFTCLMSISEMLVGN